MANYAISDLHGRMDLWNQIKNFIKEDDKIYFLGDAIDRGPDGWELMKDLLSDKRVVYFWGNHEDMILHAIDDIIQRNIHPENCYPSSAMALWYYHNGGYTTYNQMIQDPDWKDWIEILQKNATYSYDIYYHDKPNLHLCHAGYSVYDPYSRPEETYDLFWDRTHIVDLQWNKMDGIMIHGHTPIPSLFKKLKQFDNIYDNLTLEPGALWYAGDHKICIDNGSFATGITCLLNLDDWTENIFTAEPDYSFF